VVGLESAGQQQSGFSGKLTPGFVNILFTKVGQRLIPVVELCVDRLSATGAAFFPPLTAFWDESHVVEKDHHFDEAVTPLNVRVHIAPRRTPFGLLPM
jgi:hypothetical protein